MAEPFTDQMKEFMRLEARNASRPEIFKVIFGKDVKALTDKEANRIDATLYRWRHHPDYQKEWLAAFKAQWNPILADAMVVVQEGLHDDSLPWRKTQHANLALAYGTKMIVGEEERSLTVKIEGMPEIGSLDDT